MTINPRMFTAFMTTTNWMVMFMITSCQPHHDQRCQFVYEGLLAFALSCIGSCFQSEVALIMFIRFHDWSLFTWVIMVSSTSSCFGISTQNVKHDVIPRHMLVLFHDSCWHWLNGCMAIIWWYETGYCMVICRSNVYHSTCPSFV